MESSRQPRVLIVDDEAGVVLLQSRRLERCGYQVMTAANQQEARRALAAEKIDVMLVDYRLNATENGLEFFNALQRDGVAVPTILVTGFSNESLVIEALRAGVRDFVPKTIAYLNYLPEAIGRVLEQEQIRARLSASESRFAAAFQASPTGICITDLAEGRIVDANDSFLAVLGCQRAAVLGRTFAELGIGPDGEGYAQRRLQLERDRVLPAWEAIWQTVGRGKRILEETATRVELDHRPRVLAFYRDLTRRRQAEEQLRQAQKMEAIGRLAGGVAHDFNNLLTIILGYAEIAREQLDSANEVQELLAEIESAAQRAARLTGQLLAFSRRQVLAPAVININSLVAEMQQMFRRLIGEDVELDVALDDNLNSVRLDASQLEQLLLNLVVNARDAMPQGGRLTIATKNVRVADDAIRPADQPPGDYVRLLVRDEGLGMSPEVLSRIFEPFFTTKAKGQGTGMGLATVFGIVKQSQGHIAVTSRPGEGSCFQIDFPRVADAPPVVADAALDAPLPRGNETVLLVEDEAAVRQLACRVLRDAGYVVLDAASGVEALSIAARRADPIDLVMTDAIMPGMSGSELVDELCKLRPDVKVLFVSGYTDELIGQHGVLESGHAFLQKPFTRETLATKVRQVLDQ